MNWKFMLAVILTAVLIGSLMYVGKSKEKVPSTGEVEAVVNAPVDEVNEYTDGLEDEVSELYSQTPAPEATPVVEESVATELPFESLTNEEIDDMPLDELQKYTDTERYYDYLSWYGEQENNKEEEWNTNGSAYGKTLEDFREVAYRVYGKENCKEGGDTFFSDGDGGVSVTYYNDTYLYIVTYSSVTEEFSYSREFVGDPEEEEE